MKKILLLLLITPLFVHSQNIYDLNLNGLNFIGVDYLKTYEHYTEDDHITIPDNEYWLFFLIDSYVYFHPYGLEEFDFGFYLGSDVYSKDNNTYNHFNTHSNLLEGGTKFYFEDGDQGIITTESCDDCIVRIFKFETTKYQNSLSYNETDTIKNNSNTPVLFPNPTSSLLALNSDKEYDIEVYDMAGNKVMALTGNTIDMSHLSSATYIVKALDKAQNEEVSYKVVKN
jgi:hypothetical protein